MVGGMVPGGGQCPRPPYSLITYPRLQGGSRPPTPWNLKGCIRVPLPPPMQPVAPPARKCVY